MRPLINIFLKGMIIPIGMQCTNATLLKQHGRRVVSFPFDWMFSTPKFVFSMLELLLETNITIEDLVTNHFFYCTKRAKMKGTEHYHTCITGGVLYNSKYNVIFPHDRHNAQTIGKYIRRFQRLKDTITNATEELCFVYCSPSSSDSGNFTIDGKNALGEVYLYLSKIYQLIGKYNRNYKLIIFDAIKEEPKERLDKSIILYELTPCAHWIQLSSQIDVNLL